MRVLMAATTKPEDKEKKNISLTDIWNKLIGSFSSDNKIVWALLIIVGALLGVNVDEQQVKDYLGVVSVQQAEELDNKIDILSQRVDDLENPEVEEAIEEFDARLLNIEKWRRP